MTLGDQIFEAQSKVLDDFFPHLRQCPDWLWYHHCIFPDNVDSPVDVVGEKRWAWFIELFLMWQGLRPFNKTRETHLYNIILDAFYETLNPHLRNDKLVHHQVYWNEDKTKKYVYLPNDEVHRSRGQIHQALEPALQDCKIFHQISDLLFTDFTYLDLCDFRRHLRFLGIDTTTQPQGHAPFN